VYNTSGFRGGISDYVFEFDDIGMASEGLEDFDLSFHFAFLDGFERLDNYVFVIGS
jgi:hypothetical protein